jgi:hypothetical protein
MMAALAAGGMPAAYSPSRQWIANCYAEDGYHPTPGWAWEIEWDQYDRLDQFDGRLVKVFAWGLRPPLNCQLIIMRRDKQAIRRSYERGFQQTIPAWWQGCDERLNQLAQQFPDSQQVRFDDLLLTPREVFCRLTSAGWPVDADAAASVINPALANRRAA